MFPLSVKISTLLYIYIYIFELFFAEFQRGFESVARFMDFVVEILNWVLEFVAKLFRVLWGFFCFD